MAVRQTNSKIDGGDPEPPDLLVSFDRSNRRDLREQLERELRAAIREGRLRAGTALPATRVLARQLDVARSVVVEAYGQLTAEGYLEARRGSGTRVRASGGPDRHLEESPGWQAGTGPQLRGGLPDAASFPRRQWQRHYRAALNGLPDAAFGYPHAQGTIELRTALAAYLGRVRAVATSPEGVLICGGFTHALALLCRVLRARGATHIAVEDPCFAYHRRVITTAGLEAVPIPVDDEGLDTDALARQDVAAVLVAPAHSYPIGATLSPRRRAALAEWAHDAGALVIEDDYDAEFRYDRAPLGALQGLAPERIVYGGSVSKTLSPMLRVGWLVVPPALIDDLRREKFYDDMATAMLDQLALARFIEEGDFTRHLRRIRPVYRSRRDAVLRALATHMPDATVDGVAAGLHLFVRLPRECDERMLVLAAGRQGVRVEGAARHWADPHNAPPALVIGYGPVSETEAERGIAGLGAAYEALGAGGR